MDTVAALEFEEYVRTRHDALLRSARRLTPNPADAQDLLQIALSRTFPVWDGIVDKRHADAYIRRALINTRTTLWRSRKLDEYATDQLPESAVEDGTEQRADRAMLLGALGVLPQQQRDVVVLRYYEGMSTAETAQTLGISAGTVKSTLHRALARLRTELERQGERGAPAAKARRTAPARPARPTAPVQYLPAPRVPSGHRPALTGARAA
jgi:RNA polymerase sigma-70 factor (sigma-E family)